MFPQSGFISCPLHALTVYRDLHIIFYFPHFLFCGEECWLVLTVKLAQSRVTPVNDLNEELI